MPNHILIEGDNLHALTALTFTHEGRVDVIYIDPPYNTGNKDFKYNDRFVDREDSYRHSKWLSFMAKRLRIAKRLLAETGVVFISIDDNEQAQLKLLCDEVFGEEKLVTNLIIQSNKRGQTFKDIAKTHEYLLCYTKNLETRLGEIEKEDSGFRYSDEIGEFSIRELRNRNPKFGRFNRPNLFYPIYVSSKKSNEDNFHSISLKQDDDFDVEVIPLNSEGGESCWRWGTTLLAKNNTKKLGTTPVFAKQRRDGGWNIYEKYRKTTERVKSIWDDVSVITEKGGVELRELGLGNSFTFPKPVGLIAKALKISANPYALILDFFAGSGTTLHATMQLNAEDGGNRQCILVTNNENNIAEEVCYERNKRVIQGYENAKGQPVPGLTNNNLRYFRCGLVPSARTEENRRQLTRRSTELLKIKENCYTDRTEASGFDPETCFVGTDGRGKYLVVMYHSRRPQPLIAALTDFITNLPDRRERMRLYAFGEEKDVLLSDFHAVADLVEAVPLPEAIYNAYRATFRTLGLDKKLPHPTKVPDDENEKPEQTSLTFTPLLAGEGQG